VNEGVFCYEGVCVGKPFFEHFQPDAIGNKFDVFCYACHDQLYGGEHGCRSQKWQCYPVSAELQKSRCINCKRRTAGVYKGDGFDDLFKVDASD
jgi:hypothetical protein